MPPIDFHLKYKPTTANPYLFDETYFEVPPSQQLKPFIRCFWGSGKSYNPHTSCLYRNMLIIPDTCFDILFIKNNKTGIIKTIFTGMNDRYVIDQWAEQDNDMSLFAIRFHFWTLSLFSRFPMAGTINQVIPPEEIFPHVAELCELIFERRDFKDRICLAEQYLITLLSFGNLYEPFFNGTDFILKHKGVGTLQQLSLHLSYSERQVQRIFLNYLGITPKHFMNLVRYQSVWQEILSLRSVNYIDIVHKYGYTDQSHLIADFKKHHSMTPQDALLRLNK